jgi:hypothetical protein
MDKLPNADSNIRKLIRYGLTLIFAFVFAKIGDQISAFFVSFTHYIDGASALIGYILAGIPFGWIIVMLFDDKAKSMIFALPIFMLIAALLKSIYHFIDQERVFHIVEWLSFQVSSGLGLRFFYVAFGAYIFFRLNEKHIRKLNKAHEME